MLLLELKKLKVAIKGFNVLYIENSSEQRREISQDESDFFENIYVAKDESEALHLFKMHHSKIVVIDVTSVSLDWQDLSKKILKINSEVKILILSGHDGEKNLYDAIEIGINNFLQKPLDINKFYNSIYRAIIQIREAEELKLFYAVLNGTYSYDNSMIVLMKNKRTVLANQKFLDFFSLSCVNEFMQKHKDIGTQFLEHPNFLFNKEEVNWLEEISANEEKIYHVNMRSTEDELKHFIIKYRTHEKFKSYSILSFDDVTDLKISDLYKVEDAVDNKNIDDSKAVFNLLELIHRNQIVVHLYNYYKGLTLVNDATIQEIGDDGSITFKTEYIQQKAIVFEGKTLISSELLPASILCEKIIRNSFEKHTVKVQKIHFSRTSPAARKTIRLLPEENHTISLFINNSSKYKGRMKIEDISLDSIRVKFNTPPNDIKVGANVVIDMILNCDDKPMIINSKATVFKKMKNSVIFLLDIDINKQNNLLKYITNRQIDIIKEFKQLKKI